MVTPLVGAVFNNGVWSYYPVTINGNNVTFTGIGSGVYMILQAQEIVLEFVNFAPQYTAPGDVLWTAPNTTLTFKANVGTGFVADPDEITVWINNDPIGDVDYNAGYITWEGTVPVGGMHTAKVLIEKNAVTAEMTVDFMVDGSAPVVIAAGGTLPANRQIRATIVDPETDIKSVRIRLDNSRNIEVTERDGDDFVYTLTISDMDLVGNAFIVKWFATNNVDIEGTHANDAIYNVNLEAPIVTLIGPDQQNVTLGMELEFSVTVPEGVQLMDNGVTLTVEEELWIENQHTPGFHIVWQTIETNIFNGEMGDNNTYFFSYQYNIPPHPAAIRVRFTATAQDSYGNEGVDQKLYGVLDTEAPVVQITTPTHMQQYELGAGPVVTATMTDNVGVTLAMMTLFAPDGEIIEEFIYDGGFGPSLVWIQNLDVLAETGIYTVNVTAFDSNNLQGTHSVQFFVGEDTEAPVIVFSAPYEGQRFDYGTTVTAVALVTDNTGLEYVEIILSGNGSDVQILDNSGNYTVDFVGLETGEYTFTIRARDFSDNWAQESVNFIVLPDGIPPSVEVAILPQLNGGFWLGLNNTLRFTVDGTDEWDNIIASTNIYTNPGGQLIASPPANMVDGVYNVNFNGAAVPADQLGITFEVIVNTSTQYYDDVVTVSNVFTLDRGAPVITRTLPVEDETIVILPTPNASIYIEATAIDPQVRNAAASGLKDVEIIVNNATTGAQIGQTITLTPVDEYANLLISQYVQITAYGTYRVRVIATDNAGNQTIDSFIYTVSEPVNPEPIIEFMPLAVGNWLNLKENNELTFTVTTHNNTALRSVTAELIVQPTGETIVVGNPVFAQGRYTVNLQGNRIPESADGIKMIVTATDITNAVGEGRHVYEIDRSLPTIVSMIPDGNEFTADEELVVDVQAKFEDNIGIASARLVWNKNNELATTGAGIEVINAAINNPPVGTHTLTLTVTDVLGNVITKETTFTVVEPEIPPTSLDWDKDNPPYAYPNPGNAGEEIKFALNLINATGREVVTLRVFDFAGRLVYEGPGTSWDGRTTNGVRVARGTYFARITVNNGTKIVESVVKVAIR
jgi:hypothetical protein